MSLWYKLQLWFYRTFQWQKLPLPTVDESYPRFCDWCGDCEEFNNVIVPYREDFDEWICDLCYSKGIAQQKKGEQ